MPRAKLKNVWSHLPAWGALLLGFGTLIGDARADRPALGPSGTTPEPSSRSASRADEVLVRIDGEKIYISQDGDRFEELRLGDNPEAAYLKTLLRHEGADGRSVSVPVGSMIVASGGGSGKGEKPKHSRATGNIGSSK
ncbi:hypothetical protein [Bradyrhizobium sp. ARR65]|uniref:hypothetical protein n=1 Tax=Bradyrhizobium sp. ARR65 TaxID=1040989 RepID=UPI0004669884|nr:hypothetical protein [Bradyrhizobium sp. ARR65]